ncbi:MAG: hypothetical protein IJX19_10475 [Clostridia bacterium]|nr:hypothetical protein [Clostridia bacterium]
MDIYRVTFIGHRRIEQSRMIEDQIEVIAKDLLRQKEYVEFYVGRNGDFDISVASAIKRAQKAVGDHNSSLSLVLPYHVKDESYYGDFYDEVLLPIDGKTHFKSAITKRNEWMIDQAELLIAYVETESGGAYQALQYARKKGIFILNIAKK